MNQNKKLNLFIENFLQFIIFVLIVMCFRQKNENVRAFSLT